jgi:hypothetical protein
VTGDKRARLALSFPKQSEARFVDLTLKVQIGYFQLQYGSEIHEY